jgi:hypothetical protein
MLHRHAGPQEARTANLGRPWRIQRAEFSPLTFSIRLSHQERLEQEAYLGPRGNRTSVQFLPRGPFCDGGEAC